MPTQCTNVAQAIHCTTCSITVPIRFEALSDAIILKRDTLAINCVMEKFVPLSRKSPLCEPWKANSYIPNVRLHSSFTITHIMYLLYTHKFNSIFGTAKF